jgi:hypothetical protein
MISRTLTISAALGAMLAAAGPARAQSLGWGTAPAAYANDDFRATFADAQRAAYDNGYRDGLKRGEQAARDRRPLDVERERDYRGAENGYNRSHGDKQRYREGYRGGFAQGYRDGYSRRGAQPRYPNTGRDYGRGYGYGGNASYGAYRNGVSDGYTKGLDDAGDRKYPDVRRQKWYRNGDHDYDGRDGPKETYRLEYRRGFEEGYNRAYRDARSY